MRYRKMIQAVVLCLVLCGVLYLAACGRQTSPTDQNSQDDSRPDVVATLFPYYDFARQIGGDRIHLTLLLPAGRESHSFEPTPADMIRVSQCDLFLYNGGEMEAWVEQVLEAAENPARITVCMMDYVQPVQEELTEGMEHDHDVCLAEGLTEIHEIEYDEHIWTSPRNAVLLAEATAEGLIQADPKGRSYYEQNLEALKEQLLELDSQFRQVVAEGKRNIIIFGDKFPFRYFADEYGLEYDAAFPGCSSEMEPSAATIAGLIDRVRKEGIPVIYHMELSSSRTAQIISEETGAQVLQLHSCHNVSRADFLEGVTYVDLMRQNVENLRKGLE